MDTNPTITEMAANALDAFKEAALTGFSLTAEEEQTRRLEICGGCEFYNKAANRCTKCGCYLILKTSI